MSSPGCLVTSTPEFTAPERTRPFLIASTADPDPRNVLLKNADDLADGNTPSYFQADVVSEDQGLDVQGWLLVDYGRRPAVGSVISNAGRDTQSLKASTMADTHPRPIRGQLFPLDLRGDKGCHTVTLIVSHDFVPFLHCPVCRKDSSQITWHYQVCDPASGDGSCDLSGAKCENFEDSCPADGDPNDGIVCGAALP